MFGKCTRKLTFRWMLLAAALLALGYTVFYLAYGKLPANDQLLLTTGGSEHAGDFTEPPWLISRWFDILAIMLPVGLLAWTMFDVDSIEERWIRGHNRNYYRTETGLLLGMLLGVCGYVIIGSLGMTGLIWGTAITSVLLPGVIYASWLEDERPPIWQVFLVELVAVIVIFAIGTVHRGAVVAAIYAGSALGLSAAITFGLFGLIVGFVAVVTKLKEPFVSTMLSCEVEERATR